MILPERKHYERSLPFDHSLIIRCSLESSLGGVDNYRYKQSILGKILLQDEEGKDLEEISRLYNDWLLFGTGATTAGTALKSLIRSNAYWTWVA